MKQEHTPTVGFVIDWIENFYQENLLSGVKQAATERDVNLLCFVGGALNSPRIHESIRNSIYRYISHENLDALVIAAGSIGIFSDSSAIEDFCNSFKPIPVVSISQALPNICSILVDNTTAYTKLLEHMHKQHGHQRIAFVSGPKTNIEAIERLNVYNNIVNKYSLPVNEDYIYYGNFTPQSGLEAVHELLDNRKLDITCIAAANDDMAYGVIEGLSDRGIIIPHDMAVIGFDDQVVSPLISPPLTTIKQPVFEQGQKAIFAVLDILEGKDVPLRIYNKTREVYRESCGCLIKTEEQNEIFKSFNRGNDSENNLKAFWDEIEESLGLETSQQIRSELDVLLDFLQISVEQEDADIFIYQLNRLLYSQLSKSFSDKLWYRFINRIQLESWSTFSEQIKKDFHSVVFQRVQIVVASYLQRRRNYKNYIHERNLQLYRDLSEELVAMHDLESISDFLYLNLPRVGIRSCYFSLYDNFQNKDFNHNVSKIILAYDEDEKIDDLRYFQDFPSQNLLPDSIIDASRRYSFLVEPVYFGKTQLGVVLYSVADSMGFSHDIVRRVFLNMALKATIFVQQIQKQTIHLEEANFELVELLQKLENTQDRLIQSEKMAALGGLVAGVAHEINTPIGVSVTAASHLHKKSVELIALFNDGVLKKSDLEKYLNLTNDATKMVLSNLQRAYDLIRSFKKIAVDQSTEDRRVFNVKEYFEEVLTSLSPKIKKTDVDIQLLCSDTLVINSYPGVYSQVLTNLVMNSLIHGFEKRKYGEIKIVIEKQKTKLKMDYSDNGKGIAEENLKRVFDPFFTTKRNQGGTGLGLHILFNLITQKLDGTVKCYSSLDQGARFVILLPVEFLKE